MDKVCKTRKLARAGKLSKPHYFLCHEESTVFTRSLVLINEKRPFDDIISFENRIEWSTWGPSRVAK